MKIIDLLVKISKGEEVPDYIEFFNLYTKEKQIIFTDNENVFHYLDSGEFELNSEVSIIEEEKEIEKKIKKIIISMDDYNMPYVTNNKYQKLSYSEVDLLFAGKINELIDLINDMRDKE